MQNLVIPLNSPQAADAMLVGHRAALLNICADISDQGVVIEGMVLSVAAYDEFMQSSGLEDSITELLNAIDLNSEDSIAQGLHAIHGQIIGTEFSVPMKAALDEIRQQLSASSLICLEISILDARRAERLNRKSVVQSYACIDDSLEVAIKQLWLQNFDDNSLRYLLRNHLGFDLFKMPVLIRSHNSAADSICGIAASRDLDTGFIGVNTIIAQYGECYERDQHQFSPDEYIVHKEALLASKYAILKRSLGHKHYALRVSLNSEVEAFTPEAHFQTRFACDDGLLQRLGHILIKLEALLFEPVQIFWSYSESKGIDIQSVEVLGTAEHEAARSLERYLLQDTSQVLVEGRSIGHRIASGPVRLIRHFEELKTIQAGDVIVCAMTEPDWEPYLAACAGIVCDRGGRTCHAAILARELGIPAVVGCADASEILHDAGIVTVSCAEGDVGRVFDGRLHFLISRDQVNTMPEVPVKMLMNIGNPDRAFDYCAYPNRGVGLARLEFIINRMIGIHPKAILEFSRQSEQVKAAIERRIAGYNSPVEFYVGKLAEGLGCLGGAFWPKPVTARLSDFKSNEYGHLIGGQNYEPDEENPMLGMRGVARYISEEYRACFALECEAVKFAREAMGFTNIEIMLPFCRTVGEAKQVIELLADNGLRRGENGLRVIMMCEVPANALLAEQFLQYFDGFSIGSNDLTQLTLGLDRDSALVAHMFDERNEAVKQLLSMAIKACKANNKTVGICGQGPSDHPDFARWLIEQGIDSISLPPDSMMDTWMYLAGS